jgi:hypothetical protein
MLFNEGEYRLLSSKRAECWLTNLAQTVEFGAATDRHSTEAPVGEVRRLKDVQPGDGDEPRALRR